MEKPDEQEKIRKINSTAFDTNDEANLVDASRKSVAPLISLVAEEKGKLIGHIIFSPVSFEGNKPAPLIAGLGQMAVMPECQNKGVGSRLIEEGLRHCKSFGYKAIVVLGHPEYYLQFGFVPSINYDIKSEYQVPSEIFMVKELDEFALKRINGTIKYHQAFNEI